MLASIPSPTQSVWHLGPFPIRAYALCIITGIVVAIWLTNRRWRERGGDPDHVWDVAGWAIVFGILGGRIYHVVSDPELYFTAGKHPINALKIWDGGLGIWGAITLGGVGAWIGCRRRGIRLTVFADACVPGVIFAQGIGRLGNWFNNELYGGPTSLPWGLQIHCLDINVGHAVAGARASGGEMCAAGSTTLAQLYQPTFLYELLWDVAIGFALILIDRRLRLGRGNVLALYVMGYTLGRVWIEMLRTDHANDIFGVRLNVWTSIVVFLGGLAWFLAHDGFRARREESPYYDKPAFSEQPTQAEASADIGDSAKPAAAAADIAADPDTDSDAGEQRVAAEPTDDAEEVAADGRRDS
ncbi:MAG: prolipoprotein diacylglyceryl transferase [Jatrophihabitans sp.]